MTVRRGGGYGDHRALPDGAPIASSDTELCRLVVAALDAGERRPTIGLLAGDLCRTLGGTGDRDRLTGDDAITVPVDLGVVTLDGRREHFVAHVVAGAMFGRDWVAIMNAQFLGVLDLGPRSHPGDGLLDITSGTLPWRQRRIARRRARSGTHLPHPMLSSSRARSWSVLLDRPTSVTIDGIAWGSATTIAVDLLPDAFLVTI